jgi:hypothetical protein
LGLSSLPTVSHLTGQGNWFWTYSPQDVQAPLAIYRIGSSSPSATYSLDTFPTVTPYAMTIGILNADASVSVVDLSQATPYKTDYQLPIAASSAYTALSNSQWLIGNQHGVVLDGASLSTTPRYLTLGEAWSIAGGSGRTEVATASGTILYFDPSTTTAEGSIGFSSSKIASSADGTVLAAAANSNDAQYEPDRTLKVFSLPGESLINSWPYSASTTTLFDFTLAGSGITIGQITGTYNGTSWSILRQVGPVAGGPAIWSETIPGVFVGTTDPGPIRLSPDGTLVAVSELKTPSFNSTTKIYKNGVLVTAVPGWVVGWVDDNQVLVNQYISNHLNSVYDHATLYNAMGTQLSQLTLPELKGIQPVTSSSVYSPDLNEIFSLTTGQATWSSPYPSQQTGAVSGSYIVFEAGNRVLVDTY